ncbi:MAG TPA: MFS transporter [Candidatus Dormibacteraeota bacterium]|nr:MFS transporter [Candidatus Dormibacteraeota bacterium]
MSIRARVGAWRHPGPIFWLLSGQLIMFTGIAALFPIAPLYVGRRGGGAVVIALFVAAPLIANTLVQVPAGRLADRIGRRPMLLGSRLIYGVLALLLFADVGPLWVLAVLRTLQGVCAGAYVPALLASITDLSEPGTRGTRFAQMQACEMVGLLLGPLLGGAAALWRDSAAFGVSGVAVLVGTVPMSRVGETRVAAAAREERQQLQWWRERAILIPSLGLLAVGAVFSMYDVVWPQYLAARGNDAFVIGLSISLFAVPILFLARTGGRLSDRLDRRRLVPAAMLITACCASSYPFMRSLPVILAVGVGEAVAFVFLEPTLYAIIGDNAPAEARGHAMGVGGFAQFSGSAFGAALLGALYGLGEGIPFWGAAGVLAVTAVVCALLLPRRRAEPVLVRDTVSPLPMREGEPV